MSYEQRDNGGILFRNDKEGNEARPDYTGTAMIGNKPFYISAWIKQGKKGKFMSLSFKPKTQSERHGSYEEEKELDQIFGMDGYGQDKPPF